MEEHSIRYCRICGSDILVSEEICPKCGGSQTLLRRGPSTVWIIALIAAGFIGIILLGIVSAVVLPWLVSFRANDRDTSAYKNIVTAKKALDSYFVTNGAYPDTLEQLCFKADEGISVNMIKTGDRMCTLIAVHVNGSKEFAACCRVPDIFRRNSNTPESKFLAVR